MSRRSPLVWLILAAVILIVAYAWVDGGREPLHEISVPVALPEGGR